ncbi:MAG: 3-deoxy-D-manno-octulosonic acid transferase [Cypionkella sp.]
MALSLGRTLYNLAAARRAPEPAVEPAARPAGALIWLHAPTAVAYAGLAQIARRIEAELGAAVLLTCPDAVEAGTAIVQPPPYDSPTEARRFLDHWRPSLVLFTEGEMRPAVIAEAALRRIPMFMANARDPHVMKGREGWYPGLIRHCLAAQTRVFAVDESGVRAFRRAGAGDVVLAGRLEEASAALTHHEPERAALASLAATRPIWLGVAVPEAEEAAVIAAHRAALRLSHRLLLILVPQDFSRAEVLVEQMEREEGWTVAQRRLDQEPDPETTVYIPDSDAEYGLWYRLAPVCFMGGSLSGEGCARNPMEAAAMGSAIIYGPKPGPFGTVFGRLGAAQAARAVGAGDQLGEALSDLLAPDRTAKLAQAAWTLSSDGVEASEQVFEAMRLVLDGAM